MARTSITATKTEIAALLAPAGVPATSGVTAVYAYEPAGGQMQGPTTISVFTAGMTPTEWMVAVRIYQTVDIDAADAQATMDTILPATDRLLGSTGRYGPSQWEVEMDPVIGKLVATCVLQVGREDGWDR